jgi:hypothetical protein
MMLGGHAISLGLLSGLLVAGLVSMISILLIMERMKKQIKDNMTPLIGFKKTLKTTLLLAIDIHIVTLLISVCFIFFGKLDLNVMGTTIAIGILLSTLLVLCL